MEGSAKPALALAIIVLLTAGLSACGGGGETTSSDGASTAVTDGSVTAQTGDDGSDGSGGSGGDDERKQGGGSDSGGSGANSDDPRSDGSNNSGSSSGDSGSSGPGPSSSGSGGESSGGSGSGSSGGSGASQDFIVPGGDNSVAEFGSEASDAERSQASRVLERYMQARQAEDQQTACSALSSTAKSQLQDLAQAVHDASENESCAAIFTVIDEKTPKSARANTMTGPIGSLRVEGKRGFALYHGTKGTDYTMNMEREGDSWKVAALAPYPIS